MVDLSTTYLGLDLSSPVVASAGPLTGRRDTLRALEEAGVAAVVLPSLFEEEIVSVAQRVNALLVQGTGAFGEAETYLPEPPVVVAGPERHIELVHEAKSVLHVPAIASVNGTSAGGWVRYARLLADAGADAIECNVYHVASDPTEHAGEVEQRVLDTIAAVCDAVDVPVAAKVGPYYSAFGSFAFSLARAGARGIVCFNRFYQPDIDLEGLDVASTLDLSTSADLRLPLRWIAILARRVECDLACSGGVHTADDVVKAVLAGADAVMTTSSVLRHGPGHVTALRDGLARWLADREYTSVSQARGSVARASVPDPDAYERANYLAVIDRATARFLA